MPLNFRVESESSLLCCLPHPEMADTSVWWIRCFKNLQRYGPADSQYPLSEDVAVGGFVMEAGFLPK